MDKKTISSDIAPDFLADCRLMLRFARRAGADVPPDLEHQVALLDAVLKHQGLPPISDVPVELIPDENGDSISLLAPPEMVLKLHRDLSAVVAPATALSLQTSEPPPGRHTFVGGMPLVVKWAAAISLLSAIGFVISAGMMAVSQKEGGNGAAAQPASPASASSAAR